MSSRQPNVCTPWWEGCRRMVRTQATAPPAALTAAELLVAFPSADLRLAGDAAERAAVVFREVGRAVELLDAPGMPDSAWVARIGRERATKARVGAATPLYLRPPDVGPPGVRLQ